MGCNKQNSREVNEIMYKMAEFLLQKMFNYGLIDEKEKGEISVLNIETFSPELSEIYL